MLDHFVREWEPIDDDYAREGSVKGSPPGADDGRWLAKDHDQDAQGREASQPKPLDAVNKAAGRHPGPRIATRDITARDQQWIDIGSGIMSRTFVQSNQVITTTRGGPCMADVQHRKIWSLSTGRLLDECDVDDTPDEVLHRKLNEPDDLRVEITLRNAMTLFERKRPRRGGDLLSATSLPRGRRSNIRW